MNPVSLRLLSQQLAAPLFKDPAEVVSWFGAMQAQDYKSMRWAVSMRTRRPSGKAFEKAYNDGRIVRTHLLRTTWQLLAGEDLGSRRSASAASSARRSRGTASSRRSSSRRPSALGISR